jgi:hypothetical protein
MLPNLYRTFRKVPRSVDFGEVTSACLRHVCAFDYGHMAGVNFGSNMHDTLHSGRMREVV